MEECGPGERQDVWKNSAQAEWWAFWSPVKGGCLAPCWPPCPSTHPALMCPWSVLWCYWWAGIRVAPRPVVSGLGTDANSDPLTAPCPAYATSILSGSTMGMRAGPALWCHGWGWAGFYEAHKSRPGCGQCCCHCQAVVLVLAIPMRPQCPGFGGTQPGSPPWSQSCSHVILVNSLHPSELQFPHL